MVAGVGFACVGCSWDVVLLLSLPLAELGGVGFGGAAIEFRLAVVVDAGFGGALSGGGIGKAAGERGIIVATGTGVEAGVIVFLLVLLVAALAIDAVLLPFVLGGGVGAGANDTDFLLVVETWRFLGGGSSLSLRPSSAGCLSKV